MIRYAPMAVFQGSQRIPQNRTLSSSAPLAGARSAKLLMSILTSAEKAKSKALEQLKAKAAVDQAVMAERRRERELREQALSVERAAKAEASAEAKAQKAEIKAVALAEAKAAAELKAARLKPASAADMKAARDARYAARKTRK